MSPRIIDIQRAVARHYSLPVAYLREPFPRGQGKIFINTWNIAHPRQVAMYLTRRLTKHSRTNIGRHFGGRDKSTVFHACRAVERKISVDAEMRENVAKLRDEPQLRTQAIHNCIPRQILAETAVREA
jgi:chromosomal replication initiator protein